LPRYPPAQESVQGADEEELIAHTDEDKQAGLADVQGKLIVPNAIGLHARRQRC